MYSMYAECKPKVSVMIWGCITWHGSGSLCKVDGNINAVKYILYCDTRLPVMANYCPSFCQ